MQRLVQVSDSSIAPIYCQYVLNQVIGANTQKIYLSEKAISEPLGRAASKTL